jgi:hypothetical protein
MKSNFISQLMNRLILNKFIIYENTIIFRLGKLLLLFNKNQFKNDEYVLSYSNEDDATELLFFNNEELSIYLINFKFDDYYKIKLNNK